MKKIITRMVPYVLVPVFNLLMLVASAQDTTVSQTKNTSSTTTSTFQMQPWMWIAGAVVLLLIIVALFRGGDRTSVTRTTVIKERED